MLIFSYSQRWPTTRKQKIIKIERISKMPNKNGYTTKQLADIKAMNAFLNPVGAQGMSAANYQALKAERAKQWQTFVNMHQSRHQ